LSFAERGKLLLYVTRAGECVAVEPGKARAAFLATTGAANEILRAPALIARLGCFGDRVFYLLPVGPRIKAVEAESQSLLWGAAGSEEAAAPLSTTPVVLDTPQRKLIVAGCEDGSLCAWDLRTGRLARAMPGPGAAFRAAPVLVGDALAAATADGRLCFFDLEAGLRGQGILLQGGVAAPPVLHRQTLYVGTSTLDGFYGVDVERKAVQFSFAQDQIRGGVMVAPTVSGNRVYFGTEESRFYALEQDERGVERLWSYAALGAGRLVGPPVVAETRVFFCCSSGKIFAFDE
jgi:outer membrane protein assembly factor BamB